MNNSTYKVTEIEIDLKEVILDLLSQWKAVLAVALLFAILLSGAKYVKDVRAYDAVLAAEKEQASQAELSPEERIREVYESLPAEERTAVEYVVSEKEWIDKEKEYVNNSVMMHTDPTNQRALRLIFDIDADNASDLPLLLRTYYVYMYNEEMVNAVRPLIAPDAEAKYINELFYTDNNDTTYADINGKSAVMKINIVLTEETDADAVAAAASDVFTNYSTKLKARYPHSLSLAAAEESRAYNSVNAGNRMSVFNSINNLETNLKNTMNSLSDTQKSAAEKISQILTEDESVLAADSAPAEELSRPGWSKKYAVLGFVLGAILYAFAYLVWIILKGRVNYAADAGNYTCARALGEFYKKDERKGLRHALLRSNLVDSRRFRGHLDADGQMRKALSSVEAACDHVGSKRVSLLAFDGDGLGFDVADRFAGMLKNRGIDSDVIRMSEEVNEKDIVSNPAAIYVVGKGSAASAVAGAANLCSDYDIKTLGSIFVGRAC